MITCKPDTSFTVDKYNRYSDKYDLDGFKKVTLQFEDVTYQVISEKTYMKFLYKRNDKVWLKKK